MILNSSQSIQTNNPLDSSSVRRVNNSSRTSVSTDTEDKRAQEAQKQEDERVLRQLRARDREVRAHEAAHMAAGGSLVRGGPSFTLQRGPDGRSYAIGGEVQLDVSAVANDPEATLRKADQIRAAALAPAQPSPQDLRVAASANQLASRARIDIAIQRREEVQLEQQQNSLDEASDISEDAGRASSIQGQQGASVAEPSAVETGSLRANEPPAAAISAFMATAQSEPAPVQQFSQFA